ncbi:hypothetical protein ABH911_005861 [Pseudomonas protegens]|jgi:hypothetical protein|uniref:Protein NO VEIN C-terminal domain-containing protein n=1 Tax=Pseudomonas protegens (strain DSM 19095 / LMG 27888 / CFBP 6595 / CHA0) TaxID=1124983 RepID=A0A2C9EPW1_PSEPH|nr:MULTISPECIES: hypothetical protein [Pseudomonas]GED77818.1 hypothetical protein PFL02_46680 [Pseudomonas fluorescens]AGL85651.1 hypothetical protein PFLCHA0_c38850 [Pseudomonas protegens CHA0]AQT10775.1 hypothetical protein H78_04117 [Pseudomonas protegens]MBP5102990.1 hypothetical protein [Pseudomonas protegens]MBP5112650.1 hypothetical protein [Pseudomonas protegens]
MTRKIEDLARHYLLNQFTHADYRFHPKEPGDRGFDLWLEQNGEPRQKVELKATKARYLRPSNIFAQLVFNAKIERQLFESGETVIVRVFMGSSPPQVFIVTNAVLSSGARLKEEARYVLCGKLNYEDSITSLG